MRSALILLGLLATVPATLAQSHEVDSVVVIVADDLGIDRIGCYGDPVARTPNIDRLASEGTRFRTCWAAPRCSPGRAMILTGQYPYCTGIGGNVNTSFDLDPSSATLADLFPEDRGQIPGKWHLSRDLKHPGLMGFEHRGSIRNLVGDGVDYFRWLKNVVGTERGSITYATTDNVDEAIPALDHRLVVLSFNAPHAPYHVPPQHLHSFGYPTSDVLRFTAMVEAMDRELGRLIAAIDARPGPGPLIVFTADNGTPGDVARPGEDPKKMKGSPFEGGLRVPLIIKGPRIPAGRVEDRLTSVVDLFATIKAVTGSATPSPPDSRSVFDPIERDWIYSETFSPNGPGPYEWRVQSIRDGRYKLIRHRGSGGGSSRFFDLRKDPEEENDLLLGALDSDQELAYLKLRALLP